MMGEESNDWYEKGHSERPHTSLGIPPSCHTSKNVASGECRYCFGTSEPQWRSSSKYINPGYGYEKDWRSSRARVEGGGDSHFGKAAAAPVASEGWKSSIRYIDPGSGLWSAGEWRSSIKSVKPTSHDICAEWRPRVRVFKLSDCCTEWRMHSGKRHIPMAHHAEPLWRSCRAPGNPPPLKWVPPFRNLKTGPPKLEGVRKKVLGYSQKHPTLELFSPTLEIGGRSSPANLIPNAREIRAKVVAYFKLHPPLHLFSTPVGRPMSGSEGSGADAVYHSIRRYIPEGHEDHFVNPGCVANTNTVVPVKPIRMWCAKGPQHDPATHRNVINGKIGPMDHWKPPKVTLGPLLLAPAGNINKDVIDSRFAPLQNVLEPEIPSYASQLINK